MVEVFKTNVEDRHDAIMLIGRIQKRFVDYRASFDLEDCDKILCINSGTSLVQSALVIKLLRRMGFDADILPDEKQSADRIILLDKKEGMLAPNENCKAWLSKSENVPSKT